MPPHVRAPLGARFFTTGFVAGNVDEAARTGASEGKRERPTGRDEAMLRRLSRFKKWRRVEKSFTKGSTFDSWVTFPVMLHKTLFLRMVQMFYSGCVCER